MENRLLVVGTEGTLEFDFGTSRLDVFRERADPRVVDGAGNAWSDVGTFHLAERLAKGDTNGSRSHRHLLGDQNTSTCSGARIRGEKSTPTPTFRTGPVVNLCDLRRLKPVP